ncbi:ribonucleotide-diphosphate reductase subunit beta [Schumannella luteola]
MSMERPVFVNTVEYDVPVDPMDDLQCDSCQ